MNDKQHFITVPVKWELKRRVMEIAQHYNISQADLARLAISAFLNKLPEEVDILETLKVVKEEA